MIVISFGVRKSGSTLAFEMAKAVLELVGHPQDLLPGGLVDPGHDINMVGAWTDERLARLIDETHGTRIVVRTHGHPRRLSTDSVREHLRAGRLKIHVVFRDPRDGVLSLLDEARMNPDKAGPLTVDEAIARLRPKVEKLRQWGAFPSLKLRYDDFAFDPVRGPMMIAEHLGVPTDPDEVWALVNQRPTKKNVAMPHRHITDLSSADRARVEAALADYVSLVEHHDPDWFGAPR